MYACVRACVYLLTHDKLALLSCKPFHAHVQMYIEYLASGVYLRQLHVRITIPVWFCAEKRRTCLQMFAFAEMQG